MDAVKQSQVLNTDLKATKHFMSNKHLRQFFCSTFFDRKYFAQFAQPRCQEIVILTKTSMYIEEWDCQARRASNMRLIQKRHWLSGHTFWI
jgi:hypothetical protein